jgi:hypothetical protein
MQMLATLQVNARDHCIGCAGGSCDGGIRNSHTLCNAVDAQLQVQELLHMLVKHKISWCASWHHCHTPSACRSASIQQHKQPVSTVPECSPVLSYQLCSTHHLLQAACTELPYLDAALSTWLTSSDELAAAAQQSTTAHQNEALRGSDSAQALMLLLTRLGVVLYSENWIRRWLVLG